MVCLVLTELISERGTKFADDVLNAVRSMLPASLASNEDLTLERLVGMQSGIRDYWALTVLWGATPQERFSIYQDVPEALKRLGGFHFSPGTQMSYSNVNFALVGLAIERVTGETLNDLLQNYVFKPAGMTTAALRPDTSRIPPPMVAYEGNEEIGHIPYANRIEWAGDAGIQASLEDMIAYEKFIHYSARTETSTYFNNAKEPKYIDGEPANYGYGLRHDHIEGTKRIGHSGGLPGFRLRRSYMPTLGLSIIVMFNSQPDLDAIMGRVFKKLVTQQVQSTDIKPTEAKIEVKWTGNYFDEEAKLAVVVKQDKLGELEVNYDGHLDTLKVQSENGAANQEMQITFDNASAGLHIERLLEHRKFTARPLAKAEGSSIDAAKFVGKYYSEEVDSTLHVTGTGGVLYGAFDGYLGQGPVHLMRWLGENVWWLSCFRALDSTPPGYWTVAFDEGEDGKGSTGVTVGCWLARNVEYEKVG